MGIGNGQQVQVAMLFRISEIFNPYEHNKAFW
jgi:hypothetical protein